MPKHVSPWGITIKTLLFSLILFLVLTPFFSVAAYAAPAVCGDRDKLIKGLKARYREVPVALGISQKSTETLEIFTSESGTWTAVMTMSNGVACIMAAGHSWHEQPKQPVGSAL